METIFRKVSAKERLPQKDSDYFVYVKDEDGGEPLVSARHFSTSFKEDWEDVVYWLEETK